MSPSVKLTRLVALLAPLALFPAAAPALADTPVEGAVKAWVAAIDAAPGWQASYAGLTVDPATGAATLSNLSVASEPAGFALSVGSLKVDGFHASADAVFAADEIDLTDAKVTAGDYAITVPSAAIAAPVLPETGGFTWDAGQPTVSAIRALAVLTGTAAASFKAPSVAITSADADISYADVSLVGWRNGKIAASTSGAAKAALPAKDPLVTLVISGGQTRDIDLGALIAVLDPAHYANGVGDDAWRSVVGHAEYRGLASDIFGVKVTAAGATFDGVKFRQSKVAPTYAATPAAAADDQAALGQLKQIPGIGTDRAVVTNIDSSIPNLADVHLDALTAANVAGGHIGDFAFSGLAVKLGDGLGSVALGKFGIGGLVLPSAEVVADAEAARKAGTPFDYATLVPPLSYVEADGLNVALPDVATASLDRFRLDLGNYSGAVPKTVGLDLAAADLPVALLPSDHARDLLARFGYDRLHLDAAAHIDGAAANDVAVKDFRFAMKDAGSIAGSADLAGALPTNAADTRAALDGLAVKSGTLTVTDDSIVGRLIAAQAMKLKVDPEKFRQQFATSLPLMLMFLNNRDLQAKLAPALQGFIRNGGSLTATAAPAAPVPLTQIAGAATTQPFTLFTLLATSVTGAPGAQATVIPTLPAIAAAPQTTAPDTAAAASADSDQGDDADQSDDSGGGDDSGAADQDSGSN